MAEQQSDEMEVWRQRYAYDRFGNRTLAAGTTAPALPPGEVDAYWNPSVSPANNRINSQGYGYDEAGNLTAKPGAVAGTTDRAVYDGESRMVAYRQEQTTLGTYAYDGDGRRVRKAAGGHATVFVYDALGKLVAEYGTAPPQANGTQYLTADHLGSPRIVTDAAGNVKARHDYFPFGEEVGAGTGGRTTGQGYAADNVRQKFTSKERDDETGLDYFGARYYASTQGRFTSVDPYNIILEAQATAEINPEKGQAQFLNYLMHPQQWNRYVYVVNNPLKYIDPTGELLELTGSEEERKRAFERIKGLVGEKAAGLLYVRESNGRFYVDYNSKPAGRGDVDALVEKAGGFGAFLSEIINHKNTTEFRVATSFNTKDGNYTVAAFGGAATVGAEESLNGNTQIFVHPDAGNVTTEKFGATMLGKSKSSNGRQLDYYNDIADAHEFGHAYGNMVEGQPLKNSNATNSRAVQLENYIRQRRGLNTRTRH